MPDNSSSALRVSVVIPTKNRRDILRATVASILQQDEPLELIVLDDNSSDGTSEMLRAEFPAVRVESFRKSRGPAYRRNQGARLARGEFLFTIDDDCTLPHADTFARTLEEFDDPRVGAVTIPFINVNKDASLLMTGAPDAAQTYVAYDYFGGMVAFRRDLFLELGGYRPYYFMNIEEGDYAVRMLNSGHFVKLGTAPAIDHHESPIRASKRLNELGPRNHILYAWYNVPMPHLLPHILGTGARAALYIARLGHPDQAVRGYVKGWLAVIHELARREPVSPVCYKLSRELKARGAVPFAEIEARLEQIRAEAAARQLAPTEVPDREASDREAPDREASNREASNREVPA